MARDGRLNSSSHVQSTLSKIKAVEAALASLLEKVYPGPRDTRCISYSSPSSSVGAATPWSPISIVPGSGNHPHVARFTLKSPVRPSVTSIPSASSASRCRWAPSVPGPREEIVPAAEMTRCQGTGGVTSGERNFNAAKVRGWWGDGWEMLVRANLGRHVENV